MFSPSGLELGMGALPLLSKAKTRSVSAENPDGAVGGGAMACPRGSGAARRLGKGWKVRPCVTLPAESTTTLVDVEGPGVIQHIWITCRETAYRNCVLRFYWDDSQVPSVEVPLGDFFCCGHALRVKMASMAICVNPSGGMNSYFPMPFRSRCRVTVENQWHEDVGGFFYQFTYALTELPDEAAYFHAQWRRAVTPIECPEHVLLDGAEGPGHYVGTYMAWTQLSNGWWGEGEIKFFMDGDEEHPTICGTGTEDYFCGAWGFGDTFCAPFVGYPLWRKEPGEVPKHGLYRWHVLDPIRFEKDLRVTMQALGWWPDGTYEPLKDDIASVAYWYQRSPVTSQPELPPVHLRWPR